MALNHYYLNAQNLSPETRDALFDKIDGFSFLTTIDVNNPGCIEVFSCSFYSHPKTTILLFATTQLVTIYVFVIFYTAIHYVSPPLIRSKITLEVITSPFQPVF